MDTFKYLPPRFSRCVKDLVETLNITPDPNVQLSEPAPGDVSPFQKS